jgi:hypothetical protein
MREETMKILTANRLIDGEVVWLSPCHSWVTEIAGAEIARDALAEEKLTRAGEAALARNEVVDVNLIEVELADGTIRPQRLRERIRAAGPTNRTDLGKQAARLSTAA